MQIAQAATAIGQQQDWPQYLHDNQNTAASNETILSTASVNQLSKLWTFQTGSAIAAGAAVVGNTVYIGSWDGYEYALDLATGAQKWKTFLGQTVAAACQPPTIGVTSSAEVLNGVVYVGGGDNYWYALDSTTGNVLWKVDTGDNSAAGGHYNWSSPLIYNGFAYIGVASNCDAPLVQGLLLKVDLTSHLVVGETKLVPDGQVGGGLWTHPGIDPATNTIYLTTGTQNQYPQTLPQAFVAIDATSMAVTDSWQVPLSQAIGDADFGNSPILLTDVNGRQLIVASNKNGYTYALDRTNLHAGPVWQQQTNLGGECPVCGDGTASSGAYANGKIFMAGGNSIINGIGVAGVVNAIDPVTGNYIWQHGVSSPIVPALAEDNGILVDAAGPTIEVLDENTGKRLYSYKTGAVSYGPPVIANGTIIEGSGNGVVYALALPTTSPPAPPADLACPGSWTCQDIGNPAPVGTEQVTSGAWNITVGGSGLGGTGDQFRLATQQSSGDTQVTALITAQPQTKATAQAGLIIRQRNDPGSPYYAVFLTPNGGLTAQYRTSFGGATTVTSQLNTAALPLYLEIQRIGDTFQAATSTDGASYTLVPGSQQNIPLPDSTMAGLFVSSTVSGTAGTATYSNVTVSAPNNTPAPVPSPTACPGGWSCSDVGGPVTVGDQSLANGVWTVKGAGQNIAGYTDQFHYVWQPLAANGTISAHVTSQTNTALNAKAGIMLRQSTDANAAFYGTFLTPTNGIVVLYRDGAGIRSKQQVNIAGTTPAFIQVTRWNNVFSTFTSTDGTNWTYVNGSSITMSNLTGQVLGGLAVTSNYPSTLSVATIDTVTVTNTATSPPSVCPNGWSCADIGNPNPPGSQLLNNGTWQITAGGSDIWFQYDQFRYVYQQLTGDATLNAHVASVVVIDPWTKTGVMLRATTDPEAPYYAAFVTPGNGISVQYRTTQGGQTTQVSASGTIPMYLEVIRSGNFFTTYSSSDGTNWTYVAGTSLTLNMPATILAGMAVTSHNSTARTTVTIDTVNIVNSAPPPPTACPTSWSCEDIGSPTLTGDQQLNNGTWTIDAAGNDIYGTADQFHYVQQTLPGNGSISAQVFTQTNSSAWARAGVMLRATTDPGSPYYAAFATPGNGIAIQYRTTQAGTTQQLTLTGTVPIYLEVKRAGTTFVAYTSTDGANWTTVPGSTVTLTNLTGPLLAGLAVTSHNGQVISTVTMNAVTITSLVCPTSWSCEDIGSPTLAGDQLLNNGTWTIDAAGNDIWGTTDQFHYVQQTLPGNGSISAQMQTQTNSSAWARAGVMLRATTDPGSPYYAAFATPGNGIAIQYRTTQAGTTQQLKITGTVPIYLEVKRTGTTFVAYTSTDGVNWTTVPGSTVTLTNLTGTLLAGLAVTSHNGPVISTVTMNAVTITSLACPTSWSCEDIGNPFLAGDQLLNNGTWTIDAAGGDIYGTADQFHYVQQTLPGDGSVSTQVQTQTNSSVWAKAGVMLRATTDPGSPYYAAFATPGHGIVIQYRKTQGGGTTQVVGPNITIPVYLKVTRSGTTFSAYTSTDGTTWTLVPGSGLTINMTGSLLAGIAVTSHNSTVIDTVKFNSVIIG